MAGTFEQFFADFIAAIKRKDRDFMKAVYADWLETSGVVPKDKLEYFFSEMFNELADVAACTLDRSETMGEFVIAHLKDRGGADSQMFFRKKGGSWSFFNERINYSLFKRAYAINYEVEGEGSLRFLFNGKRSPAVPDVPGGRSGFISLINSMLVAGKNELTLQPMGTRGQLKASIRVSSGSMGDVMDSAQGDVLSWDGTLNVAVKFKFDAE